MSQFGLWMEIAGVLAAGVAAAAVVIKVMDRNPRPVRRKEPVAIDARLEEILTPVAVASTSPEPKRISQRHASEAPAEPQVVFRDEDEAQSAIGCREQTEDMAEAVFSHEDRYTGATTL